MRDVARAAGGPVETVYANFGAKPELLLAALDVAVVGDSEPIPLADRPEFAELGRGTRAERLGAAARLVRLVHERTYGLGKALREAAAGDALLAKRLSEAEGRRPSPSLGARDGQWRSSARSSSSRPIFERPGRFRRLASSYSSARVLGDEPPRRLRAATAAPCFPSAVRVFLGMWAIVRFDRAAACAFFTFRFAAATCLLLAMTR
jgi:AcrR family transcriptional regulator